jgi:hypothetical protein
MAHSYYEFVCQSRSFSVVTKGMLFITDNCVLSFMYLSAKVGGIGLSQKEYSFGW